MCTLSPFLEVNKKRESRTRPFTDTRTTQTNLFLDRSGRKKVSLEQTDTNNHADTLRYTSARVRAEHFSFHGPIGPLFLKV